MLDWTTHIDAATSPDALERVRGILLAINYGGPV